MELSVVFCCYSKEVIKINRWFVWRTFFGEKKKIDCFMHSLIFKREKKKRKLMVIFELHAVKITSCQCSLYGWWKKGMDLVKNSKVPSIWSMLQMITNFTLQTKIMYSKQFLMFSFWCVLVDGNLISFGVYICTF